MQPCFYFSSQFCSMTYIHENPYSSVFPALQSRSIFTQLNFFNLIFPFRLNNHTYGYFLLFLAFYDFSIFLWLAFAVFAACAQSHSLCFKAATKTNFTFNLNVIFLCCKIAHNFRYVMSVWILRVYLYSLDFWLIFLDILYSTCVFVCGEFSTF